MSVEDEAAISEINILPDGRVCVFGTTRQVLDMLNAIPLGDPDLTSRIECLNASEIRQTVPTTQPQHNKAILQ